MRRIEKIKTKIFIGLAAVCSFALPALSHANDCCWDQGCDSICDWEWYVGADYLYWKPCSKELDYAAVSQTFSDMNPDGLNYNVKRVCPEWESGYRIYFGGSSSGNIGFSAAFTHLKASADSYVEVSNANIQPTRMHPFYNDYIRLLSGDELGVDRAEAYWDSDYKEWFVGMTYQWELDNCNRLTPYIGVAGLKYNEEFASSYRVFDIEEEESEDVSLFSYYSQDFSGAGLRLGAHYHATICDCFGAYLNANGTVLVGDSDGQSFFGLDFLDEEASTFSFNFYDDGCCSFVPGYQLGLGLVYDACICNVDLVFKVGYEFVAWHNLPTFRSFVEGISPVVLVDEEPWEGEANLLANIGTSSISTSRTVAYHGLTVGLALAF